MYFLKSFFSFFFRLIYFVIYLCYVWRFCVLIFLVFFFFGPNSFFGFFYYFFIILYSFFKIIVYDIPSNFLHFFCFDIAKSSRAIQIVEAEAEAIIMYHI